MTDDITQSEVDDEVARRLAAIGALGALDPETMRKAVDAIHAAWGEVRTSVLNTRELMGAGMTAAERAKRRDTLHREAAAALGRGDRKAHRRALDDLRFLNKTEMP